MESVTATQFQSDAALAHLKAAEERHFWFASRNRYIVDFFRSQAVTRDASVVEVGCGRGSVLRYLHHQGLRIDGIELNPSLAQAAQNSVPGCRILAGDVCDESMPDVLGRYDVVCLFDVLEHAREPDYLLHGCKRMLKPGGLLIGTVPALRTLWSRLDEVSEHRIRHDLDSLRDELESAGFEPVSLRYFFQALVPVIWWQRRSLRRASDQRECPQACDEVVAKGLELPNPMTNTIARIVCGFERHVRRFIPLDSIPGASLLFAAR